MDKPVSRAHAGVDGCKAGRWVAAYRKHSDRAVRVCVLDGVAAVLDRFPAPTLIAVDIPIGLTDSGPRAADVAARQMLKAPRASSVFPAPIRPILDSPTRAQASARQRDIDGRGFGAHAWGILPRIRDWDATLRENRVYVGNVFEVHPEVSFQALNGGRSLAESKKTREGAAMRRRLLGTAFGAAAVNALLENPDRAGAADDDVLDALVALWSAERIARGVAKHVPDTVPIDGAGLPMAIWY